MIAIVQTYSGKIRLVNCSQQGVFTLNYTYDEPFFVIGFTGLSLNEQNSFVFWGEFDSINYQNAYLRDKRIPLPPQNYYHSATDILTFTVFNSLNHSDVQESNVILSNILNDLHAIVEAQNNFETLYRLVNKL